MKQLDLEFTTTPPPRRDTPPVLTVRELTAKIRGTLERDFGRIWVRGEISNHRLQSSGHRYFTLKDESSQLACVLFAGDARAIRGVAFEDGAEVVLAGDLSVYEARGQYQLLVRHAQATGAGMLLARFEALKKKLEAEGLFAAERKRPLPKFPRCVGVVTSPTGAAIRDFLKVLWKRSPGIRVVLYPARVQGQGAAREIARAVEELNRMAAAGQVAIDVLVVTRGGGSMEDLWEFNEEAVARAVVASGLPVVSAIGHEIDFTLCDFAADLRCATPSAAAEALAAEAAGLAAGILAAARRMEALSRRAHGERAALVRRIATGAAMRAPLRGLRECQQELDRSVQILQTIPPQRAAQMHTRIQAAAGLLRARHPAQWIRLRAEKTDNFGRRMGSVCGHRLRELRGRIDAVEQLLRAFDPAATLGRGFTLTLDGSGHVLTSAARAAAARQLTTRFADGEIRSVPCPPARE